jgi:hypothetical protein
MLATLSDKEPHECLDKAKNSIGADLLRWIVVQAKGDTAEGTRLWCDSAQAVLEVTFRRCRW